MAHGDLDCDNGGCCFADSQGTFGAVRKEGERVGTAERESNQQQRQQAAQTVCEKVG